STRPTPPELSLQPRPGTVDARPGGRLAHLQAGGGLAHRVTLQRNQGQQLRVLELESAQRVFQPPADAKRGCPIATAA
ncbi:MAG: hypothetical protein M0T77_13905, partial [Actinomycetota bacterium]|nr:hypothetical protein [Actinomycetota bacterium]